MTDASQTQSSISVVAFDVFISYSSKDKQIADAVKHAFHCAGIRCWMAPDDIQPGRDWAAEVADAIEACSVMVLVWTKASMSSAEVPKELGLAMSSGSVVIPFRLENIQPHGSFKYHLTGRHWLDAYDKDLDEALVQLISLAKININRCQDLGSTSAGIADTAGISAGNGGDSTRPATSISQEREELMHEGADPCDANTKHSPHIEAVVQMECNLVVGEEQERSTETDDANLASVPQESHAEESIQERCDEPVSTHPATLLALQDTRGPESLKNADYRALKIKDSSAGDRLVKSRYKEEESDTHAEKSGIHSCLGCDGLNRLACEIELIHYSLEALLPELYRSLFKRGFFARMIFGEQQVPSIHYIIESLCTAMQFTYLQIVTCCFVSYGENHQIDKVKEFVGSEQIRWGSRMIYEIAAKSLSLLATDSGFNSDPHDLADGNHDIFVEDCNCLIDVIEPKGACLLNMIDPRTGDVVFSGEIKDYPTERVIESFASIASVEQEWLFAVLSADWLVPSEPSVLSVIADRISAFVAWSAGIGIDATLEFLKHEDPCDCDFWERLGHLATSSKIKESIGMLPGCSKIEKNKKVIGSLGLDFKTLAKIGRLKQAAGLSLQC